jgi:hypothetical protein
MNYLKIESVLLMIFFFVESFEFICLLEILCSLGTILESYYFIRIKANIAKEGEYPGGKNNL